MEAHVASCILDCMAVVQFRTPFAVVTINIAVLEDTRVMWRKVRATDMVTKSACQKLFHLPEPAQKLTWTVPMAHNVWIMRLVVWWTQATMAAVRFQKLFAVVTRNIAALKDTDVTWPQKLALLEMFAFRCWKRQPQLAGIKILKSWPTWMRRFALSPDPLFEETLKDPQMDGLFVDETNGTGLLFCYSCAFLTCGLENSGLDFVRTHRAN